VFEAHGLLREDLHYVFDTEFGLRLALRGVVPKIVERELAVRYLHDDAKSADVTLFTREYERVSTELLATLTPRDHTLYRAWWIVYRVRRFLSPMHRQYVLRKKLGLLDLRERLGLPVRTDDDSTR
jgi:hypothetical protein